MGLFDLVFKGQQEEDTNSDVNTLTELERVRLQEQDLVVNNMATAKRRKVPKGRFTTSFFDAENKELPEILVNYNKQTRHIQKDLITKKAIGLSSKHGHSAIAVEISKDKNGNKLVEWIEGRVLQYVAFDHRLEFASIYKANYTRNDSSATFVLVATYSKTHITYSAKKFTINKDGTKESGDISINEFNGETGNKITEEIKHDLGFVPVVILRNNELVERDLPT